MNELQQEERQRARRQLIERSIELAMRNSWEEAAEANRRLVESADAAYLAVAGRLVDIGSLSPDAHWPQD